MDRVLALIPAYNEEVHVADVVRSARAHLPVLVVDDGSTDDTAVRAQEAGAAVVRLAPNQGKGAALRSGFRRALKDGYDAVLTLDADGQHDPSEIPKFLHAYGDRRADLIIGARTFSEMPLSRRLANSLGQWAFSWALGQPIRDNQCGYRMISRRLIDKILSSAESGFEFEVEMIAVCVEHGFALDWVPVRTIYAGEGSHIKPWHHVASFLRVVYRTRRRMKDLRPR
jgi:glycosyltransferase involved in cell wall biosynthesis